MAENDRDAPEKPLVPGYISSDNGQGMGVPARCVLCGARISAGGKFGYYCTGCKANYGKD